MQMQITLPDDPLEVLCFLLGTMGGHSIASFWDEELRVPVVFYGVVFI